MVRHPKPPSQTWRTFLTNHVKDLVSVDFFTVPTVTFRVFLVFIVLSHHRRRVMHFNVTEQPTAAWTAQQIVEAFPWDSAPSYLLRDRDGIYGGYFSAGGSVEVTLGSAAGSGHARHRRLCAVPPNVAFRLPLTLLSVGRSFQQGQVADMCKHADAFDHGFFGGIFEYSMDLWSEQPDDSRVLHFRPKGEEN